ncbi:MAG: twin-arginine translocase subunit TatB [Tistrella sp.]|jgi:sec-independent protein translocase protein TatB|uniref:Sec-independent protein translocase protein TatB n=1 Tax=Tistrella mobilis TaxID=171437 RepID=A0A3B9ITB1_9PROT|nr:Sec-independent protein translocase protein TatB [Tistrella sp.]MAD36642.1 twin-arginine translocase subunit TatB [Tistrella sp.]MBA75749.1 twin-arginine translocase subunit TatB [Tistrella sp.]HAE51045.1 twin-arginine translocase subunit TatB [Tistrella mobilis]
MFDIGWAELALVFVVALIVIGPKDLPVALRAAGVWMGRLRRMAREFQSSVDEVLRESELKELRDRAEKASRFDMGEATRRAIDPDGALERATSPVRLDDDAPAAKPAAADAATPAAAQAAAHPAPASPAPASSAPAPAAPTDATPAAPVGPKPAAPDAVPDDATTPKA